MLSVGKSVAMTVESQNASSPKSVPSSPTSGSSSCELPPSPSNSNSNKRKRSSTSSSLKTSYPDIITTSTSTTTASLQPSLAEVSNDTSSTENPQLTTASLSKTQQKKLLKKQKWEESRESRRLLRRQKLTQKRQRQRDERVAFLQQQKSQSPAEGLCASEPKPARRQNRKREKQAIDVPIKCIVDCSFDDLMLDKEIASLGSQVSRCYADNRSAPYRMDLWITSFNARLEQHLKLMYGTKYLSWRKIRITSTDYELSPEDIGKGNIIYLSSDSPDNLETLDEGKTYIVGGIVDKNRHKGLCYNKAVSQGLRTAKLPIEEYIKMSGRITMTTNHVVEIMLKWLEMKDWKEAFLTVIPPRKTNNGNQPKNKDPSKQPSCDAEMDQDGDAVRDTGSPTYSEDAANLATDTLIDTGASGTFEDDRAPDNIGTEIESESK